MKSYIFYHKSYQIPTSKSHSYRPKHAILTEFAKDFRAVCLWSGLHAQRAFWHCNCGQHGSCGIPIPSEYFSIGFHLKIMKNHSNDSNRDLFHFSRKNVVDGERLLALQSASGLDAVSGRSISSRTECVAPQICGHGRRRIVVFYWFYKQKYCANCTVFSFVFPLFSHIRVRRCGDFPSEYHASADM